MATAASILGLTIDPLNKNAAKNPALGLLVGPLRSGKTSLAFAAARALAARNFVQVPEAEVPPRSVWFACRRTKIEACLPAPVKVGYSAGTAPTASLVSPPSGHNVTAAVNMVEDADLEYVAMKYFTSIADLKAWCLRVHELGNAPATTSCGGGGIASYPAAMVLDDLDLLLEAEVQPTLESVQRTLLHALALLKHACAFVAERTGMPCPLLVVFSEASPWHKELRPLLERELGHRVLKIARHSTNLHQFSLVSRPSGHEVPYTWTGEVQGTAAHFSI